MNHATSCIHLQSKDSIRFIFALLSIGFVGVSLFGGVNLFPPIAEGSHGTSIVGVRMGDKGPGCTNLLWGSPQYTPGSGGFSSWATDYNGFDPDCMRTYLSNFTSWDRDFRVGIQMNDGDVSGCGGHMGPIQYTPWASEGGGESGWAYDDNVFDPNCARVVVETKSFPGDILRIEDARLGVQLSDDACSSQLGNKQYTPWASEGGGWSSWAADASGLDPDCAQLTLETKVVSVGEIEVQIKKTGDSTAPLPPATWIIRNSLGSVIAEQRTATTRESTVYAPILYGTYSIGSVPASLTAQGFTYTLTGISPSQTQTLTGPTSGAACPSGQYDPHAECDLQNGACVAVGGCGANNCVGCSRPFEQQLPSLKDPGESLANTGALREFEFVRIARALTVDGEEGFHYVCRGSYCGKSQGSGVDECVDHSDCGSFSPPPSEPTSPIPPERITFTLTYNAVRESTSPTSTPTPPPTPSGYTLTVSKAGTGRGTVTSAPGGIDCGQDCIQTYPQGTLVDLTATPSTGFSFVSWGGDADCTDGFVTMNANKNCVATFVFDTGPGTPQPGQDQQPIGWHDGATGGTSCTVNGWATDPDNRDKDIRVRIYADNVWLRDELADKYRIDLDSADVCKGIKKDGDCAFVTGSLAGDLVARGLALGVNHSMLVNAISIDPTGKELEAEYNLSGTPKTINCSTGGSTPNTGTVTVSANRPAAWTLSSALATYVQTDPIYDFVYRNTPQGAYTLAPNDVSGCTYTISPGISQYLGRGGSIRFGVDYSCVSPPSGPTFTIEPDLQTIGQGARACFRAWYDPDGSGAALRQNVSVSNTAWSINPASIAVYEGQSSSCTDGATFRGVNAGLGAVMATYDPAGSLPPASMSDTATLNVTSNPPPILTVSLTANPYSGVAPLTSQLTASVGGTETGTVNYYLWWNCGYAGKNVGDAQSQCGSLLSPPLGQCVENIAGLRCNAVARTSQSVAHRYVVAGTYRPAVIAERGASSARDAQTITATGVETHLECRNNACLSVSGSGPNRCDENADCASGGPGGGGVHSVCDAVNKACVNEKGSGSDQCTSDPACGGSVSVPPQTHLECQNDACLIVGGAGADECTAVGLGCESGEPPVVDGEDGTCTFSAMPSVIKKGESSRVVWACKGPLASCELRDGKGILAGRGGLNGEAQVKPPETTTYTLTCGGTGGHKDVMRTTTVYVSRLEEVPPQ